MPDVQVDVHTTADGSVVVRAHGRLGPESAPHLRRVLVHAMRRVRPPQLILDFTGVIALDSINVGTVVAVCDLATDLRLALFVQDSTPTIDSQLRSAGVHHRHLRRRSAPGAHAGDLTPAASPGA